MYEGNPGQIDFVRVSVRFELARVQVIQYWELTVLVSLLFFYVHSNNTVKPPLMATSTQQPLDFVPVDSSYIDSYLNLSTTARATKMRAQLPK